MNDNPAAVFVGLDLSLTSTGFCLRRGTVLTIETVKTDPKHFEVDLLRLAHIRDCLLSKIPADVKMICVEDFFTPANAMQIGSAIKLAMLGTAVRMALYEKGYRLVVVAPGHMKKCGTGKGVGEKSHKLREVYKRWNIDAKDDNQADAAVLAYIAEGIHVGVLDDTPKFQAEVIRTVRKERPRYNVKAEWAV